MPYGFIVLIASVALVIYFDFATDASRIAKGVVSGICIFCFASIFGWLRINSWIGFFLLIALSIFIIFYRLVQDARSGR